MKNRVLTLIIMALLVTPAMAEKPDKAGKGKSSQEQMKSYTNEKEKKVRTEANERIREKSDEAKGLQKQTEKKAQQTRNELGKGSEQGQQSREENSKKWWKFWE